jgi:hypothetical protein
MRVELTIDGGFAHIPGLASPIVVDSAHLAAEEAAQLRRLCDAATAIAHQQASNASALPDGRRYQLTIETEGSRRVLTAADPIEHPALAHLIAFVQQRGRR